MWLYLTCLQLISQTSKRCAGGGAQHRDRILLSLKLITAFFCVSSAGVSSPAAPLNRPSCEWQAHVFQVKLQCIQAEANAVSVTRVKKCLNTNGNHYKLAFSPAERFLVPIMFVGCRSVHVNKWDLERKDPESSLQLLAGSFSEHLAQKTFSIFSSIWDLGPSKHFDNARLVARSYFIFSPQLVQLYQTLLFVQRSSKTALRWFN